MHRPRGRQPCGARGGGGAPPPAVKLGRPSTVHGSPSDPDDSRRDPLAGAHADPTSAFDDGGRTPLRGIDMLVVLYTDRHGPGDRRVAASARASRRRRFSRHAVRCSCSRAYRPAGGRGELWGGSSRDIVREWTQPGASDVVAVRNASYVAKLVRCGCSPREVARKARGALEIIVAIVGCAGAAGGPSPGSAARGGDRAARSRGHRPAIFAPF